MMAQHNVTTSRILTTTSTGLMSVLKKCRTCPLTCPRVSPSDSWTKLDVDYLACNHSISSWLESLGQVSNLSEHKVRVETQGFICPWACLNSTADLGMF